MKNNNTFWILLTTCGLLSVIALCAVCLIGGAGAYLWARPISTAVTQVTPHIGGTTPLPQPTHQFSPQPTTSTSLPAPTPESTGVDPAPAAADETLRTFNVEVVPFSDALDLAMRLEDRTGLPHALEFPVDTFQIGDRETFWVTNSQTTTTEQVPTTLRYITDHVYFWIEDGVNFDASALRDLVETFEKEIYPRNREFFGSEWTPGVDADPHLYIVYARNLGGTVAGYYSPGDQYLPVVREKVNGHEMFFLSADHVALEEEFAYSVLAHEFQHMIHWYRDRNEETWINEGFSDLAMFLNGYSIGGADHVFVSTPDIQLTDWPTTPDDRPAHYGAAFLFLTYYLDRFGEEATKLLVSDEANGMTSIDEVLAQLGMVDPETGQPISADDVFADWVIASFLQDERVGDGRYTYHNYPQAPAPAATDTINDCSTSSITGDVKQYGADYLSVRCGSSGFQTNNYTLHFSGPETVNALPVDPYSGNYAYYSNRGDESDMTLTRSFDFTGVSGPLTLSYWTWYDLEVDYDYLYLLVSEDGQNWDILTTPDGTADDPVGNSYGWAYNGASGGGPEWIEQSVDLSQYAGKSVQLRFEYITDAAVNGEGFLLDDVSIAEVGYFTDFENDDGGWEGEGFVRIQNVLPQAYRLAVIHIGDETRVEKFTILPGSTTEIPLIFDRSTREVVLVVSGSTRFTRQPARYEIRLVAR